MFDVYLIADVETLGAERTVDACTRALGTTAWAGRVALQLRAKTLPATEVRRLARALRARTRALGVGLWINGEAAIAGEVSADGVHLPERGLTVAAARAVLGPNALVGVSRHSTEGLARAAAEGASFATLSPVFASPGKSSPLGVAGFAAAVAGLGGAIPVLALGGVDVRSVPALVRGGARGVAVIREVFLAPDPADRLVELAAAVARARRKP